ncbi:NAD-dependent epimerase/dehydratase family protein [Natrarchaeobius chitinivorans]|uniref:NAD-dependent epimerase/dehydratase family protein n=1 Tax=Natrarchaeobius chitinivorans TaxID=1679083 RepID=A0A3N6N706_NATCH|nr:NAD-dependent epimerase/dehydratase family protein [Natrarchaeobius chitinivorans]RQG94162.1 NAD-dependent epimerase/dehydratase family protein [Natrarchaeobius chitinivorans]
METVLVTGACGQIGSELTATLRERYPGVTVVSSDVRSDSTLAQPYERLDVTDQSRLESVIREYDVDTVFHLAAILSATGEDDPQTAFDVNAGGLYAVLEAGRRENVDQVIVPSSIAVFGPQTPANPGEKTVLSPSTMYGITKVLTERLGEYYASRYGLDVRGLRLPGLISYETPPGGGTTDYAVDAFYAAAAGEEYTCFVRPDTRLPMMYMPDAISALIDLATADEADLRYRCEYNVSALSFTARELVDRIEDRVPEFEAYFDPDDRQRIADSWPDAVDDSAARADWGWEPEYGLEAVVDDMLANL